MVEVLALSLNVEPRNGEAGARRLTAALNWSMDDGAHNEVDFAVGVAFD